MTGANLALAHLIRTDFSDATLIGCQVYGVSVWEVILQGAIQRQLIISRADEPTVEVDDLEVAQFIYLLLNHSKLRKIINAVK